MFDALLTVCLLAAPDVCAERLVPVDADDTGECITRAEAVLSTWPGIYRFGPITCQEPAAGKLTLTPIGPGIFAHHGQVADIAPGNHGDVSNIGVVIGENSIAVIDSGGSREVAEQVYRAIRAQSSLPISHLILTHMHPDHVFGASLFADAGAEIVGHASLPQALSARAATYRRSFDRLVGPDVMIGSTIHLPKVTVADTTEIDLGKRVLRLQAWPTAHTGTDMTVLDAATGTLFTGDLGFDDHAPALDGSLLGWEQVLRAFDAMPIKQIVPGHGQVPLSWPGGLDNMRRYLATIKTDARAAVAAGATLADAVETIGRSEAGLWALFDLFNPRNATVAFTELEWE